MDERLKISNNLIQWQAISATIKKHHLIFCENNIGWHPGSQTYYEAVILVLP